MRLAPAAPAAPAALAVAVLAACSSAATHRSTPTSVSATVGTSGAVSVGPGAAEAGLHQTTRTADGHVFEVAVDDDGGDHETPTFPDVRVRTYRSTTTGIPTAFAEVDAAHAPRSTPGTSMSGVDTRMTRGQVLAMTYYRADTDRCVFQTLDTRTLRYGPPEDVGSGNRSADSSATYYGLRALYLCSMTLLADDTPEVVVAGDNGTTAYHRTSAGWQREAQLSSDRGTHPSIVTDHVGGVHVAWLQGDDEIAYAHRSPDGHWSSEADVVSGHPTVMSNENLDQGPSITVGLDDRPVALWLSGTPDQPDDRLRVARLSAAGQWVREDPDVFAHAPGIVAHGDDLVVLLGHDDQVHPGWTELPAGASAWTAVHPFVTSGMLDGSANARFDPLRDPAPDTIDVAFMDDNSDRRGGYKPDLYYAAIQLAPTTRSPSPSVISAPTSVTTGSKATLVGQAAVGAKVTALVGGKVVAHGTANADGRVTLKVSVTRSTKVQLKATGVVSVAIGILALWRLGLKVHGGSARVTITGPASKPRVLVQRLRQGRWATQKVLHGKHVSFARPTGRWRLVVPAQAGLATTTLTGR